MATGLVIKDGSPLLGSPIVYGVTAANIVNCAFHRVNLTVSASYYDDPARYKQLTFSSPAEASELLIFDISSALRALADDYVYTPEPPERYPLIEYSVAACDEYMVNGELHENVEKTQATGGKVMMGAYSDLERILSGGSKQAQHFTRKPKTLPEVVHVGDVMVCPESFPTPVSEATVQYGPRSIEVPIVNEGIQTVNGRQIFALPAAGNDWYRFRFVNSLGCLESIGLSSTMASTVNYTTETYLRALPETFGSFSRGLVSKKNDYETWKLATPPVDTAWQSWFVHEFMMARYVWIEIDGHWVPCHILPDDSTTVVDRTSGSILSITFSVRLDINGSPMTALTV